MRDFWYVIRWFNFPLGSPLGIHFWELWVVLLVVVFVYWHLAAGTFFWQLWESLRLHFRTAGRVLGWSLGAMVVPLAPF